VAWRGLRPSFYQSVVTGPTRWPDALTPKAIIWNVMQITKIHFVTSVYSSQTKAAGSGLT
jgi:hypothetical protein